MPLLKKTPFAMVEPPKDLESSELVYQVRFTKEIFRDYHEYLNRLNLYRRRVWTCKVTGKLNMTYEEALVSEKKASEKVQQFPKELMAPVLRIIQFSMLSLKDLADTIAAKLQECLFVGAELYGRKDNGMYACKILKVLEDCAEKTQYEVASLDRNKNMIEKTLVKRDDLILKRPLFSREVLKSFIRESTYRTAPWVLHDKLAQKHGIFTDPPEDLRGTFFYQDGLLICNKKRRKNEEENGNAREQKEFGKGKRKKVEGNNFEDDQQKEEPIKYPIDDLLVQPGADDPVFTNCPSPSRDFNVPMDCFGDLLMVWDFCSSFGRLLHLWPFSLEDFEKAICHKDSNLVLIMESHSALLQMLAKDNSEYSLAVQKRKRKITLVNWTEYLCDFLEMKSPLELCTYTATIKRGHYGLLDVHAKLGILRELVSQALETDLVREKLDEYIEQRLALGATRRGEALEEGRKKREEKQRSKANSEANGVVDGHRLYSLGRKLYTLANDNPSRQNGDVGKERSGDVVSSQQNYEPDKSESKDVNTVSRKMAKKQMDLKFSAENGKDPSLKEILKQLRNDNKEPNEKRTKEQRKEYFEREMEKRFVRTSPLGKDRHYNRYWWFRRDGRVFVESSDSKQWGYYSTKEELDAVMGSLNCKGERERALQGQFQKFYSRICMELEKQPKDTPHNNANEEAALRRSTRVRAPPRKNPAKAFLRYVNKWKED